MVEVDEVREAIAAFGERYLARVYGPREIEDCSPGGSLDPVHLAARFAAKEATFKVLRVGSVPAGWREVEVRCDATGLAELILTGHVASLANRVGVFNLALSLAYGQRHAAAVVIADARPVLCAVQP